MKAEIGAIGGIIVFLGGVLVSGIAGLFKKKKKP